MEIKLRDPELLSMVAPIACSAEHLIALIGDLLDLGRIESGKLKIETDPMSIRALAEELRTFFLPLTQIKSVDLNFLVHNEFLPERFQTSNARNRQEQQHSKPPL